MNLEATACGPGIRPSVPPVAKSDFEVYRSHLARSVRVRDQTDALAKDRMTYEECLRLALEELDNYESEPLTDWETEIEADDDEEENDE